MRKVCSVVSKTQNKPPKGLILFGRLATTVAVTTEARDKENPDKPFAAIAVVVTTTAVAAKETAITIAVTAAA